jgi:hypothetical protein
MSEPPDARKDGVGESSAEQPSALPQRKMEEATQPSATNREAGQPSQPAGSTVLKKTIEGVAPDAVQRQVPNAAQDGWAVILVEDNATTREEIRDYFAGKLFDKRPLVFQDIADWEGAYWLIRERKVDLVILDIYRGAARLGGERVGDRVLDRIEKTGFTSVILYTNLAEGLEGSTNTFVHLVRKTAGLATLEEAVRAVFATRIPQMHRAIVDQFDKTLCNYMWGFVVKQWEALKDIADKPEFLRLLIQRLTISLVREGIDSAVAQVFGQQTNTAADKIHPAEMYIKPPIGPDPLLGDVRVRRKTIESGTQTEYLVVLWPSCDMVSASGRAPKTDTILCARATLFADSKEAIALRGGNSKANQTNTKKLIANNRDSNFGSSDRFHFLPEICDVPALVVDFQALEDIPLAEARSLECAASLASPFAELLASRFLRYIGRLGTPDVDGDLIVSRLIPIQQGAVPLNGPAASVDRENQKQD